LSLQQLHLQSYEEIKDTENQLCKNKINCPYSDPDNAVALTDLFIRFMALLMLNFDGRQYVERQYIIWASKYSCQTLYSN
jgi:hypothetical protein